MLRSIGFWAIWLAFTVYAFGFAPPNQPDTVELITNLSTGQWQGINPLVVALFNVMGILPLLYGCLLYIDGRGQKIPAWPFSALSFGVGAFAILPYLALRQPNPNFSGRKTWFLSLLDSRWLALLAGLGAIGLVGYGISAGDWSNFVAQWQTDRFIHVMSLDFCLLCLLFPALIPDDMARRNLNSRWLKAIMWLPLLGGIIYLAVRPPLKGDLVGQPAQKPA